MEINGMIKVSAMKRKCCMSNKLNENASINPEKKAGGTR
jgi:hypothetical protein